MLFRRRPLQRLDARGNALSSVPIALDEPLIGFAAALAAYEAALAPVSDDRTESYALLVAQDQRAALRTLLWGARSRPQKLAHD